MINLNLKKLGIASLMALPFAVASVSAVADNDFDDQIENRIEAKIYQDKNYPAVKKQAIAKLEKQGYQVVDIEADDYRFKPALSVEAYKNGVEYDIKLSYPDLAVLKEKIDR